MTYYFTSTPIASALKAAHARGVRVRVILDKSQTNGLYSVADYLSNAAIQVRIDRAHAIAHNKFLVIDNRKTITGSFNFTKSAEEQNAENIVAIVDATIAAKFSENWLLHWNHSQIYERKK